ncbi:MAG: serine hydrolase domain-containing protein [Pikeienuella sp.]
MSVIAAALSEARRATRSPSIVGAAASSSDILHLSAVGDAAPDAMFRLFSMTKLVGVITALMLVEDGVIGLDQLAGEIIPEFDALPVLDGFDGEEPILRSQRSRVRVRDLACHMSGCVYGEWSAPIARYMRQVGLRGVDDGSVAGLSKLPLAFDPGTGWGYGTSIDWLGLLCQRVAGERLESLIPRRLFAPLGMSDTLFALDDERRARLVPSYRVVDGAFAPFAMDPDPAPETYAMGSALYGTAADYLRLLQMLLRGGEGVLRPESVEMLFQPRTGDLPAEAMRSTNPKASADVDLFPGLRQQFGFGGLALGEDAPGRRLAGSVSWAGMLNTHFWVDRAADRAGVLLMQHLPFADELAMDALDRFERAVYVEA